MANGSFTQSLTWQKTISAYLELSKPRISLLLIVAAIVSYGIATGNQATLWGVFVTVLTVGTQSIGIFSLNHYMESEADAQMHRTKNRPIPSGKIKPSRALWFGLIFTFISFALCFFLANLLTLAIALFVAVSYLLVYTPLKYKTAFHTALGALPGATPPLAGWAIGTGQLDTNAWILFGIMFLWQFPHFLSIEMIYQEDYARAKIKVVPVTDPTGISTAWQMIGSHILLIIVSVLPYFSGLSGLAYAICAVILGVLFLGFGALAIKTRSPLHARFLLRASIIYLPIIFILLVLPL